MPNTREKLIELLDEATEKLKELCGGLNDHNGNGVRADHLIANGVTVQKWIPVSERVPEDGKFIIVANFDKNHTPRVVKRKALVVEEFWGIATGYYAHGQQVTHWMPLPEPPEGE